MLWPGALSRIRQKDLGLTEWSRPPTNHCLPDVVNFCLFIDPVLEKLIELVIWEAVGTFVLLRFDLGGEKLRLVQI